MKQIEDLRDEKNNLRDEKTNLQRAFSEEQHRAIGLADQSRNQDLRIM